MRFLLTLILLILLTACGPIVLPEVLGEAPIEAQSENLDQMISFNPDGYATLQGRISGGSQCPDENGIPSTVFIELEVPVRVQGIETHVAIPFRIEMRTKIASSRTLAISAQDFFIANPETSFTEAFAIYQNVEVSFMANAGELVASAIRETDPQDPSQVVNLTGIFSVNSFSQGILEGQVLRLNWEDREGRSLTLNIGIPRTLHGAPVSVLLPVSVTLATQSVFKNGEIVLSLPGRKEGDIVPDANIPLGNLRVEFTLKENILEVSRIIELE